MKCRNCGCSDSKVLDSRSTEEGVAIRRRRECSECQKRFTTYEIVETVPLVVVKRDKSRETFDRSKLLRSIISACDKRHVSREQMESIADEIQFTLQNSLQNEVNSTYIGELVLEKLRGIDEVAYIRFASVYRSFKDISQFLEEITNLNK
jgi:transcriptional repressor NrdR